MRALYAMMMPYTVAACGAGDKYGVLQPGFGRDVGWWPGTGSGGLRRRRPVRTSSWSRRAAKWESWQHSRISR